jgi:hypothetical protein
MRLDKFRILFFAACMAMSVPDSLADDTRPVTKDKTSTPGSSGAIPVNAPPKVTEQPFTEKKPNPESKTNNGKPVLAVILLETPECKSWTGEVREALTPLKAKYGDKINFAELPVSTPQEQKSSLEKAERKAVRGV